MSKSVRGFEALELRKDKIRSADIANRKNDEQKCLNESIIKPYFRVKTHRKADAKYAKNKKICIAPKKVKRKLFT